MAELGSGVPVFCVLPIANDNCEYVEEDAEPGTLLWKLSDLVLLCSLTAPIFNWPRVGLLRGCSCGTP